MAYGTVSPSAGTRAAGNNTGPLRQAATVRILALLLLLGAAGIFLVATPVKATAAGLKPGEGTGSKWCTAYGTDGAKGLFKYDNVWACGPDDTVGPTPFDSDGTTSFQCVELSERFLWAIDGLAPIGGSAVDGATLVSMYHSAYPSIPVGSPGPSSRPVPGDIISFNPGGEIGTDGHTAVVVSAPTAAGNFKIISENWSNTAGQETVHIDMTGAHNGDVQFAGSSFWNAASFLETNWIAVEAPLPANAAPPASQEASLNVVTCPSTSFCLAAGDYWDSSGNAQGLLETLSGTSWAAAEAPLPAGAAAGPFVTPEAVACAGASSCAMTGYYDDASGNQQGLLDTLSGATWRTSEAPLPVGASPNQQVYPASVACPKASSCVAAGWYGSNPVCGPAPTGNGDEALLWTESGISWTVAAAPLPTGASTYPTGCLGSVACPSRSFCVAVGYYVDSSGNYQGLLETRSGGTWTPAEAPVPANAAANPSVTLGPVTCRGVSFCMAIGSYLDSSGNSHLLVETLSGGTWTAAEAPGPTDATYAVDEGPGLDSLACASPTSCSAAGEYIDSSGNEQGLLETLSGGTWTPAEAPLPAGASPGNEPDVNLPSIACPSSYTCAAVGDYPDSSGDSQGLLETRLGGTWKPIEAPLPASNSFADLYSVTCPSTYFCVAVGEYGDSGLLLIGPG